MYLEFQFKKQTLIGRLKMSAYHVFGYDIDVLKSVIECTTPAYEINCICAFLRSYMYFILNISFISTILRNALKLRENVCGRLIINMLHVFRKLINIVECISKINGIGISYTMYAFSNTSPREFNKIVKHFFSLSIENGIS